MRVREKNVATRRVNYTRHPLRSLCLVLRTGRLKMDGWMNVINSEKESKSNTTKIRKVKKNQFQLYIFILQNANIL